MIENILIQNEASYGFPGESLSKLAKINFIYGSNGAGKTTISRLIADESRFPECRLNWKSEIPLKALVYNKDFVDKNFNQSSNLKGIFTLGEKDIDTFEKINEAKSALESLKDDGIKLKNTLEGEDGRGGKKAELDYLESEFEEQCWKLKQKYDATFQEAFSGVRGKKAAFKEKLLNESDVNKSDLIGLDELKEKASTVFGTSPQTEKKISPFDHSILVELDLSPILRKKVVGKEDINLAAMIKRLGNSDWVRQGREFYRNNEMNCPFCQQQTRQSFAEDLDAYFDEEFEKDLSSIEKLLVDYKANSSRLLSDLGVIISNPSRFIDTGNLKLEKDLLESKIKNNIQLIENKQKESSRVFYLDSLADILTKIGSIIDSVNNSIDKHNITVANISEENTVRSNMEVFA